ncbi:MAG TPA: hypothetical protein VGM87_06335 [Roseomonas sp.]|jgi:hypothetical protein
MRHARHAALLAALVLTAPPLARACDPEELNQQLTAVCRAALAPAAAWIGALHARATAAERGAIDAALGSANEACDTGDPTAGAREAARLARLAGRIEARLGETAPIWPERLAAR